MVFDELELTNVGPHSKFLLTYTPGILGVCGRNGKGKSTLIDVSQYFAITGALPEGYTKQDLVSWGATVSTTCLKFHTDESKYTLTRSLTGAKACLIIEDISTKKKEILTSSADIKAKMIELLGMSFEVFRESRFVGQGKFVDIVNMSHSERMTYFQKLTGLQKTETIRSQIQTTLNNMPVFSNREKELKELEELNTSLFDRISLSKSSIKDLESKFKESEKFVSKAYETRSAEDKDEHQKILDALTKEMEELNRTINRADLSLLFRRNDATLQRKKDTEEWIKDKEVLSASLSLDLATKQVEHNTLVMQRQDLHEQGMRLNNNIDNRQKLISLATSCKCPHCEQDYIVTDDFLKSLKEEAEEFVVQKSKLTHTIQELLNKMLPLGQSIDKLASKIYELNNQIFNKKETLKTIEEELRRNASLEPKEYFIDLADSQLVELIDSTYRKYEATEKRLTKLSAVKISTKEQKERAEIFLTGFEALRTKLNTAKQDLAVLQKEEEINSKLLNTYTEEQNNYILYNTKRYNLEKVRDILHKDNLPRMVMRRTLAKLNIKIQEYMDKFAVDFVSYLGEDFEFYCDFPQKNVKAVAARKSLSGGQKVALALAFRFALSDTLGNSAPIMVLDEPTVHLDADNVEAVVNLLQKVREVAEKGSYIFICSPHEELEQAFTERINL